MTDDPNVEPEKRPTPEPAPEPEPNVLSGFQPPEVGGEEAEDLDATQLEAAAEGAEDEVSDEDLDADEQAEAAEDETIVLAAGGPSMRNIEPEVRGPRPRGAKAPSRTAFAIDPALRIQVRASAVFVIGTVIIFILILGNAMLFGRGGAFTPILTPSPIPQASNQPTEAPSAAPTASPAASGSTAPTSAPSSSPAGSTAPTAAPSTAPSPAAS